MSDFLAKTAVSAGAGIAVSEAANLNLLWTALVTLAISIVTNVGSEIVKMLVAFFKKKTHDIEEEDKKEEHKEGDK